MTLSEALELKCFHCKKPLAFNGYANYEHIAVCCDFIYKLKPRVMEYDLEVSKAPVEEPLFHHPV